MKKLLFLALVSLLPAVSVVAQTASLTASATSYSAAGGTITFTVNLTYTGAQSAIGVDITTVPANWAYGTTGGTNVPQIAPTTGDTNNFSFAYFSIPASPASFTFTVTYPAGLSGNQTFTGMSANFRPTGGATVIVPISDIVITPAPTPPAISTHPASQTITVGQSVTFSVVASGFPAPTYQWRKGGVAIGGATSSSYMISSVVSADAGSYDVVATNSAGSATSNAAVLTVNKASQTITFGTLTTKTFGDTAFTLTATASSGLAVSYASSNTSVATISGSIVSIVGAGTTTITASQAGNGDYNAATISQTLAVSKAAATVTLGSLSATFSGSPKPATATTTPSGLNVTFTYDGSSSAPTNAGSYAVVGTISDSNYTASASGTLVIGQASQTITFGALPQKVFSDGSFTLTATASSGLSVTYTSSDPAVATVSGGTVTFVSTGATTITANQAGNSNYNAASPVAQTLQIVPALQTITFGALPTKTFGDAAFTLNATASSGLTVSYASSNTNVATISGSTVTIVGAGTSTITASQAGNANFGPAPNVLQTLTVNKAAAAVTLSGLAVTYDGAAKSATATTTPGGLAVTVTYSGSATAPTNAGTYAVVVTINEANYAGSATGNLVIAKANQTIAFDALPSKTFGDAAFALTAAASSGLPVSFASSDTSAATVSGNTVTILTAGNPNITASQAGDANFNAATPVVRALAIAKAAATLTLTELSFTYNGSVKGAGAATNPAGLAVSFSYVGTATPATAPHLAGSYAVTATISDNRYQGSANGTLTINKANQAIAFAALPSRPLDAGNFTLTATADSGLPVSYSTSSPSSGTVVTISGSTVTLVNTGTITITASQAGDTNYNAATSVNQVLTVLNQSQSLTFDQAQLPTKTFGNAAFAITAASNRGLLITFTSSNTNVATVGTGTLNGNNTTATVTLVGAGTANITATQVGNSDTAAGTDIVRTLTVSKAAATVTLGNLAATYDGSAKSATATTNPTGLTVNVTYAGNSSPPTNAGTYAVVGTVSDNNYTGSATGSLVIAKADQSVSFAAIPQQGVTSPAFALNATATSNLAVTYASSNPAVAIVNGNTVVIVGAGTTTITASQAGNSNFNAASPVAQVLTVIPVPVVGLPTPGNVRTATVGTPVSVQLTATPAATSFGFTGQLPPGLSMNAAGLISGTPTTQGSYTAQITAANTAGTSAPVTLLFTVNPGANAPVITSAPVVQGQVGQTLTYTLTASPAGSTTYSMTGTLPSGLSFNGTAGTVTGTPSAGTAGLYVVYFVGTNTNASGGTGQATDVTFNITPALGVPIVISNGTASGQVGQAFNYLIAASNSPTSFGATGLPSGLSVNTTTGAITGSPTTATTTPVTVMLTATNSAGISAEKPLLITIAPAPATPVITSGATASGRVGIAFTYQITASESPTSFVATNLPAGLSVNTATGAITGTPTQAGPVAATIAATNAGGLGAAAPLNFTIASAATAPAISSAATAIGQVGQVDEFRYQITTTGGTATSYAVTGTLPAGLSLNSGTGLISGRPTTPGVVTVSLTATGEGGTSLPQSLAITINPALGVPVITSPTVAAATTGGNFTYTIAATNMPTATPYPPGTTLDAVNLPAGLAVNPATGVIQGIPATVGSTTASLFGTNVSGLGPTRDLVINVQAPLTAPVVNSASLASAQVGVAFTYQITATGNPTSFEVLGSPLWMTINNQSGVISGTPTAPGTVVLQVIASNSAGASNPSPVTVSVAAAAGTPVITSTRNLRGQVSAGFSSQITASLSPTSFLATGLPAGLTLNVSTGAITGTPTASGAFHVVVSARNASGLGAPVQLTLTILPSATLVAPGL